MKFKSLSLVLCLSVASGFASAQTVRNGSETSHAAAASWFSAVNADGPDSQLARGINNAMGEILNSERQLVVVVGREKTKDGKSYLGVSWAGDFFPFELTAEQADACGIAANAVGLRDDRSDPALPIRQIAVLEDLKIENESQATAERPISGSVRCRMLDGSPMDKLPKNTVLRIAYKCDQDTVIDYLDVREIPADGVLKFGGFAIQEALGEAYRGPTPVFVDLCVLLDGDLDGAMGVASNSCGKLVQVKTPGELVPAGPNGGQYDPEGGLFEPAPDGRLFPTRPSDSILPNTEPSLTPGPGYRLRDGQLEPVLPPIDPNTRELGKRGE